MKWFLFKSTFENHSKSDFTVPVDRNSFKKIYNYQIVYNKINNGYGHGIL